MPTIKLDQNPTLQQSSRAFDQHASDGIGVLVEEIEGLIRVYKNGHVERTQLVQSVPAEASLPQDLNVNSKDIVIDKSSRIWARFYVPNEQFNLSSNSNHFLPLLVYFHGGGFAVGSAAWTCYHEFLVKLSSTAGCVIMSLNYRLAPENLLPAPYEDGVKALIWLKQEALSKSHQWWSSNCDFSKVFLVGDSAGGNIAHNVATRVSNDTVFLNPLTLVGTILIQPFFGGENRTNSEKYLVQRASSALSLAASDIYWRLALPYGVDRDHPWCNPLLGIEEKISVFLPTMVCVSEMDILKDRNLEFCGALCRAGKKVECVVYNGVGHAFQILSKSQLSQTRTREMIAHIQAFISQ